MKLVSPNQGLIADPSIVLATPYVLRCPVCQTPITHDAKFPYVMIMSSARHGHADVKYTCSLSCREAYAMSDGLDHVDPVTIVAPEQVTLEDGSTRWTKPIVLEPCNWCCALYPDVPSACFQFVDGVREHNAALCVCDQCAGTGQIGSTSAFCHSDDPAQAEAHDGPVTLFVCELNHAAGDIFDTQIQGQQRAYIKDNSKYLKEMWKFDHAASLLEWSRTAIQLEEHLTNRHTFRQLFHGKSEADAAEIGARFAQQDLARRRRQEKKT